MSNEEELLFKEINRFILLKTDASDAPEEDDTLVYYKGF